MASAAWRLLRWPLAPGGAALAAVTAPWGRRQEAACEGCHGGLAAYDLGATLGRGAFATVRLATRRETGEAFALKLVSKARTPQDLHQNEVQVLRAAGSHRHIAKLVDHFESERAWAVVLEFAAGGEVFEHICEQGAYSERTAATVVRQVAEALRHLHARGIVHRDLKPENLLLSSREGPANVLLCDFGLARFVGLGVDPPTCRAGTPGYMAPEVLTAGPVGPQVDVWSLGVIMFILLSGYHPFNPDGSLDEASVERKIVSGQWDFNSEIWGCVSNEARELIKQMLHPDPACRMKISKLLESPWVTGDQAAAGGPASDLHDVRRGRLRRDRGGRSTSSAS
uniref:Protein kinase domain-containing protein n=1 Tax=Alexandrium monilatum TaxID=311494 RepID=A0A7S4QZR4_9DINO